MDLSRLMMVHVTTAKRGRTHVSGVGSVLRVSAVMGDFCGRMVQHVLAENQATPYATLQNKAGAWVLPGTANFSKVANELTFPSSVASPYWVNVTLGRSGAVPSCAILKDEAFHSQKI